MRLREIEQETMKKLRHTWRTQREILSASVSENFKHKMARKVRRRRRVVVLVVGWWWWWMPSRAHHPRLPGPAHMPAGPRGDAVD